MKRFTSLLIALCFISVIGGCCGYNRCSPCGCGSGTQQGFGTYGGYGTQYGSLTPGANAYYGTPTYGAPTTIQPNVTSGQPVATIAPASYSAYAASAPAVIPAPAYPAIAPAQTAAAPLDSLPTY